MSEKKTPAEIIEWVDTMRAAILESATDGGKQLSMPMAMEISKALLLLEQTLRPKRRGAPIRARETLGHCSIVRFLMREHGATLPEALWVAVPDADEKQRGLIERTCRSMKNKWPDDLDPVIHPERMDAAVKKLRKERKRKQLR
jgi:hypothetical protein